MTKSGSIHILGCGAIGGLVGYEVSTIKSAPTITLLWRNQQRLNNFIEKHQSTVTLNRLFKPDEPALTSKLNAASPETLAAPIENLIVTTKTYQTQAALKPYLHLISPKTNILLIQNGLGVVDELYRDVWPQVESRPNMYQGVTGHGAFITPHETDFVVSHAGYADMNIAKLPRDLNVTEQFDPEPPTFIKQLIDAKDLNTKYMPYTDLLLIQLKKFMVNACINPVTAIVNCVNGELVKCDNVQELFMDIISEAVDTFFACIPALKGNEAAAKFLDKKAMYDNVMSVGTVLNVKNSSSMRQDVLNLRDTEIDYINGFVVTLAEKNGLKADANKTVRNFVKLRLSLDRSRS